MLKLLKEDGWLVSREKALSELIRTSGVEE